MGLRGRFTLWFALTALAVIAVVAIVTLYVVSNTYRDGFARRLRAADVAARRQIDELRAGVEDAAANAARDDHPVVGGLMLDLEKYGELPADERRDYWRRAEALMAGLRLDELFLIADRGDVIAAPHRSSEVGTTDTVYRARAREPGAGTAYFAFVMRQVDGEPQAALVAEVARTARGDGRPVTVVMGRALSAELLDGLRAGEGADARVIGADGAVAVDPRAPWDAGADIIDIPLPGPDGKPVARLQVSLSDADLRQVLRRLTFAAAALAGAAVLLATLLGFVVARGMSRDLDELVAGAQAIARGELDHRVDVRKRDEIGAVAAAFNAMSGELSETQERLAVAQRIAAWQEIARRLAHEIKNPLTPIQMSVETMRKTREKQHPSFDEVFDESTVTILEEVGRLKRIVSEFSEFARLPKPTKGPVDLNDVVSHTLSLYPRDGALVEDLAADLPAIEADRDQLAQVVLNLVENARDALGKRPDGRVTVRTRATPTGVQLIVEDNGPGLSPDIKDKLFTPYFTTKHAAGGTGLGLAIVHRIITDHGGKITPADAPAGGARFTVDLPVG